MSPKHKVKKNNTKSYKDTVRKDIRKRIKKRIQTNTRDIGDISRGSRVVKRTKTDIYKAPGYRAEKIKSGGYHSTFPSGQGVIDKEMSQMAIVENAFRKQNAASAWSSMYRQGANGELDAIPEETRKQIMETQRKIENEQLKDRMTKELETKTRTLEELTNKNLGALEGQSRDLIRYKNGKKKPATKKTIRNKIDEVERDTEKARRVNAEIEKLDAAEEKNREQRRKLDVAKDEAKNKYKDDETIMALIDDPERLKTEVLRRDRLMQDINENAGEYEKLIKRKKEYVEAERKLMILHEELTAKSGWEDAHIAGAIADIIRIHGDPAAIRARVEDVMNQAEAKNKELHKQYKEYNEKSKELAKNFQYYGAEIQNVRNNVLTYLQDSKHVEPRYKKQMKSKRTEQLLQKAETIKQYIPGEIANQLNLLGEKHKELTTLISILNKNKVDFIEPSRQWIAELSDIASRETTEYADLHADEIITDVMSQEDMDRYANECIVVEGA